MVINCRLAEERIVHTPQIGGTPIVHRQVHCSLKLRGRHEMLAVYQRLFELGLEGSLVTTICPATAGDRWSACPFRE